MSDYNYNYCRKKIYKLHDELEYYKNMEIICEKTREQQLMDENNKLKQRIQELEKQLNDQKQKQTLSEIEEIQQQ